VVAERLWSSQEGPWLVSLYVYASSFTAVVIAASYSPFILFPSLYFQVFMLTLLVLHHSTLLDESSCTFYFTILFHLFLTKWAVRTYGGVEVYFHAFLNWALDGGERSASLLGHLFPWETAPVPIGVDILIYSIGFQSNFFTYLWLTLRIHELKY
jgi:hypothetical protein